MSCAALSPAQEPRYIWFDRDFVDKIEFLYNSIGTEYMLCVEGDRRADSVYVEDFRMLPLAVSTATSTRARYPCSHNYSDGVLGVLHNHPNSGGAPFAANCVLSKTDIDSFLKDVYKLTFVQCGPRKVAWWTRYQVENAEIAAMLPVDGQLIDFPETDDEL